MSEHKASLVWERGDKPFELKTYSRDHVVRFPNGIEYGASAAPNYRGNPALVDPESGLVAALSSCHMLTFLAVAAMKGFVVERYEDDAVGHLEKNAQGKMAVTRVELRPRIVFGGDRQPAPADLDALHHKAHEECFIANSVLTAVTVLPAA